MNRILIVSVFLLAACTPRDTGVRVTSQAPAAPPPRAVVPQTRTEPIFYNGRTYQLHFAPAAAGAYAMTVSGMSAGQGNDAEAVATSSLRYFACKDGQNGKLTDKPTYREKIWRMTVRCT